MQKKRGGRGFGSFVSLKRTGSLASLFAYSSKGPFSNHLANWCTRKHHRTRNRLNLQWSSGNGQDPRIIWRAILTRSSITGITAVFRWPFGYS